MVPQPLHDENDDVRRVLRALPAVPFATSPRVAQPAVVRVGHAEGQTYVYAVNDFPDEIDLVLWLSCDAGTRGRRIGSSQPLELRRSRKAGSYVELNIAPYGVSAFRLEGKDVRVVDVRVTLTRQALAALRTRVDSLTRGMRALDGMVSPHRTPLANPGFEVASKRRDALPGWDVSEPRSAGWRLDRRQPRSGRSALRLTSAQKPAALESIDLPLESNRFLSMNVWLRSDRAAADVRLAFSATLDGKPHTQYAKVKVGTRWRRYLFRVREIPPERLANARVRVEVRGGATLWVDDVDISLRQLTEQDARQLTKVHSAIALAWEENRYADCRRLLESYWGRYLAAELVEGHSREHTTAKPDASGLNKLFRPPVADRPRGR
jgi:hypothetical protein